MRIRGFDFTSAPTRRKPITCAECRLDGTALIFEGLVCLEDFAGFEAALAEPGPWVAGLDFPFAQPRALLESLGLTRDWREQVLFFGNLPAAQFVDLLTEWKAARPTGEKEPWRACEGDTGAASPMKLYGVPVGRMFHRGAIRLLRSGAHLPGLAEGDRARICLEAYPGVAARRALRAAGHQRFTYKAEGAHRLPAELRATMRQRRRDILAGLTGDTIFGLRVEAPSGLIDDEAGDQLDALLAAVQAAWAWRRFGIEGPADTDPLEGWIADPAALGC